jgi:pyruvate/2-oxoglutarate dehydrogenase complex dihydrolipoamide dehydrogenase (E3) component/uncharacterized membrane protein YdjX (TVP38/TMEM64 family)
VGVAAGVAAWAWQRFDLGGLLTLDGLKASRDALVGAWQARPAATLGRVLRALRGAAALSIPGALILTLAAGAIFGLGVGLVVVSFASSLGALLAFLAARHLLRDAVQARFGKALAPVNEGVRQDGAWYLLTLRLVPVFPFFLVNLLMALTPIGALRFYAVSQLGMLAATAVYVNAGTRLASIASPGDVLSPALLGSLALLGAFPLAAKAATGWLRARRVYAGWRRPARFERNLVVIGAGSGGLVSAYIAAAVEAKVTLIEAHRMGGDCLNTGCVPSKALIRSAGLAKRIRQAEALGLRHARGTVDFRGRDAARAGRDPRDRAARLGRALRGAGRRGAAGPCQDHQPLDGGGAPGRRDGEDADHARHRDRRRRQPHRAADPRAAGSRLPHERHGLGSGRAARAPRGAGRRAGRQRAGAELRAARLAGHAGRGRAAAALAGGPRGIGAGRGRAARRRRDGAHRSRAVRVEADGRGKRLIARHDGREIEVPFDALLCAVGRTPRVSGYGLEALGIPLTGRGTIETDACLRTRYPNIYAVGDVAGPFQLTHAAAHQAWTATINALFGRFRRFRADYSAMPWATFTDPEVARVGLSESEAREQGIAHEVTRYGIDDLDRAIADGTARGFVKVLTVPGKDRILGVTIVGRACRRPDRRVRAGDAPRPGLKAILGTVHAYPTLAEANKHAAGQWRRAHAPRRLLAWVGRYHAWERA